MPDIWFDVDIALASVPVNLYPLVAKADGTTINAAVAYDAAGMDLNWNFSVTGGVTTQTNVVPTTGGAHDWAALGNGMYTIEIPASAGTINNNTEGFGWFSGETTAEMAWRGPTIGFRNAELNNLEINKALLNGLLWSGTFSAADATTITMADEARANAIYVGARVVVILTSGTNCTGREYFGTVGANREITVDPSFSADAGATPSGTIVGAVYAVPKSPTSSLPTAQIADGHLTAAKFGADCITNAKIADDAFGPEHFAANWLEAAGIATDARAQIQTECNDAIVANKLDHLVAVADSDDPVDNSIMAKIAASDGDWSGFSATTDALEAIRDTQALEATLGTPADTDLATDIANLPTATEVVDEFETQSQADPTGFHVNVLEVNSVGLTGDGSVTPIGAA